MFINGFNSTKKVKGPCKPVVLKFIHFLLRINVCIWLKKVRFKREKPPFFLKMHVSLRQVTRLVGGIMLVRANC